MTVFSFHPAKTITTGEGGAVLTNDEETMQRLRCFRNNGIVMQTEGLSSSPGPWYYEVHDKTGNYHMTDFQAALGLSQTQESRSLCPKTGSSGGLLPRKAQRSSPFENDERAARQ